MEGVHYCRGSSRHQYTGAYCQYARDIEVLLMNGLLSPVYEGVIKISSGTTAMLSRISEQLNIQIKLNKENVYLLLQKVFSTAEGAHYTNILGGFRWKVRSGVEMHNMRNLVNYRVPLIGGSKLWPFHDIASPNLIGRYYMSHKVTFINGCHGNYCNHGNRTSYYYLTV